MLLVLLSQFPLEVWEKGTPEQQRNFIQEIGRQYLEVSGCKQAGITVFTDGKMVFVVADCLDKERISL